MTERGATQEILAQLMELEEDRIIVGFHQEVQKEKDKSWHDRHIKKKKFKEGDMVLLYDSKYLQHPGKFRMHWLGPYEIKFCHRWRCCAAAGFNRKGDSRIGEW
jgi:hypothetical protein